MYIYVFCKVLFLFCSLISNHDLLNILKCKNIKYFYNALCILHYIMHYTSNNISKEKFEFRILIRIVFILHFYKQILNKMIHFDTQILCVL